MSHLEREESEDSVEPRKVWLEFGVPFLALLAAAVAAKVFGGGSAAKVAGFMVLGLLPVAGFFIFRGANEADQIDEGEYELVLVGDGQRAGTPTRSPATVLPLTGSATIPAMSGSRLGAPMAFAPVPRGEPPPRIPGPTSLPLGFSPGEFLPGSTPVASPSSNDAPVNGAPDSAPVDAGSAGTNSVKPESVESEAVESKSPDATANAILEPAPAMFTTDGGAGPFVDPANETWGTGDLSGLWKHLEREKSAETIVRRPAGVLPPIGDIGPIFPSAAPDRGTRPPEPAIVALQVPKGDPLFAAPPDLAVPVSPLADPTSTSLADLFGSQAPPGRSLSDATAGPERAQSARNRRSLLMADITDELYRFDTTPFRRADLLEQLAAILHEIGDDQQLAYEYANEAYRIRPTASKATTLAFFELHRGRSHEALELAQRASGDATLKPVRANAHAIAALAARVLGERAIAQRHEAGVRENGNQVHTMIAGEAARLRAVRQSSNR